MEGGEAPGEGPAGLEGLQRTEEVLLWIIEHVWVHHRPEILQVVGAPWWPEMDMQPLSLEERWRLRVSSAQVYAIVKSRDMGQFEKVLKFMEDTFSLLPTLVPAIKHMKILFGLKTMVIMTMFREGRGTIETVSKINQFFPNKLPQYQDHCTQREMFLMRKNHQDFKGLAQSLALNKERLQDYIQADMEDQYGERYAQKVEERLLLYLSQLEAVAPADTHVDKILKKPNPLNEVEKLLLDIINCDCTMRPAALRKLLRDVASYRPARAPSPPDHVENDSEESQRQTSAQEGENEGLRGDEEAGPDVSKDSLCSPVSDSKVRGRLDPAEVGEVVEERQRKEDEIPSSGGTVQEASPHFCSKHRRWVRSILQECPHDSMQDDISPSPPLFPSSSSSSQDLTPSDLVPVGSADKPPSQTSGGPVTSEPEHQEDKTNSRPSTLPQSSTTTECLLSPVIRLVDIGPFLPFNPRQASPESFHICSTHQALSVFSLPPPRQTSGSKDSAFHLSGSCTKKQTTHESQNKSISLRPSTRHSSSKVKFRQVCSTPGTLRTKPIAEDLEGFLSHVRKVSAHPTSPTSFSPSRMSLSTTSTQQAVLQNNVKSRPQTHKDSHMKPKTLPRSTAISSAFLPDCLAFRSRMGRVLRARLRLSLQTQAVLLQSHFLQPYVSLSRLSSEDCYPGRASTSTGEEEEEGWDSSFDLNELYSDSSSSDAEDELNHDPNYKPKIDKKRLKLEYDNARGLNST